MDDDWDRRFGPALRAAEGIPDEDGTLPAARDPRSGEWDVVRRHRFRGGVVLMAALAVGAALVWFARSGLPASSERVSDPLP